jgi:SsrA-binding protein
MEILNRKASFNYEIIDTYECGIVLTGTEIKSLRGGHMNIKEGYARVTGNELFLCNAHISEYEQGNIFNHDPLRIKKLLAHKKEIIAMQQSMSLMGYTLVPLKVYFVKGRAKVLIGVAKGKKLYDKRKSDKEKTVNKEIAKAKKEYNY